MKFKNFLLDAIKGTAIGASCLIPGISGGTIALFLGVYKKMIFAISSITSNFLKSIKTLLPILLGVIIGVIGLWIPLKYALAYFLFGTLCLFSGFIIGGLPEVIKPLKNSVFKKRYIIGFLITFSLVVALSILSVKFNINADSQFTTPYKIQLYFELIGIWILASFALVIPGISGSMILLILGFYNNILSLIDNFKNHIYIGQTIGLFLCLILGIIIGAILVSKLLNKLYIKYESLLTWSILGFILGSIFSIFYNTDLISYFQTIKIYEIVIGFVLLIVGAILVGILFKVVEKKKNLELDIHNNSQD